MRARGEYQKKEGRTSLSPSPPPSPGKEEKIPHTSSHGFFFLFLHKKEMLLLKIPYLLLFILSSSLSLNVVLNEKSGDLIYRLTSIERSKSTRVALFNFEKSQPSYIKAYSAEIWVGNSTHDITCNDYSNFQKFDLSESNAPTFSIPIKLPELNKMTTKLMAIVRIDSYDANGDDVVGWAQGSRILRCLFNTIRTFTISV